MQALIYNNLGQILRVLDAPEDYLVVQKQQGEFILFGSANDETQYIDVETAEIRDIPPKPNDYSEFNWQIKQWQSLENWLDKAKTDGKQQVNQSTSAKILSVYPDYKQRNMTARYLELTTLNETDGDEGKAIADAWAWIKDIRTLSNTATASIDTKTTLEEITAVVDEFKLFNT